MKPTKPGVSAPKPVPRFRQEGKIGFLCKRVPQTSTVIVDRPTGEVVTLTSVIKAEARNVDLKALGITVQNTRVTRTVGMLLEVDSSEITNTLAETSRYRQDQGGSSRTSYFRPPPRCSSLRRRK